MKRLSLVKRSSLWAVQAMCIQVQYLDESIEDCG